MQLSNEKHESKHTQCSTRCESFTYTVFTGSVLLLHNLRVREDMYDEGTCLAPSLSGSIRTFQQCHHVTVVSPQGHSEV